MRRGVCTGASGVTYIAEYRNNAERSPIRIFATEDFQRYEIAWIFDRAPVRHVHAIVRDPFHERRIWIATGDLDPECRIHFTDDEFRTLETFLVSGQTSRAVDIMFTDRELIWGMDSPTEPSYICRVNRTDSQYITRERRLTGPAFYTTRNEAGGMYVSTAVEKGPAVVSRHGRVIGRRTNGAWDDLFAFRKDVFPQHGLFYMPAGVLPENFLVFSQRALRPFEGSLTIARDWEWSLPSGD